MKVRTVSLLAAAVATAFMASHAPAASAQRNNGTFVAQPQPQQRTPPPQRTVNPVPSTLILPIGNPVAPMANPVAPIVNPPFIRYSDTTPTVVVPEQSRGNRENRGNYGRGGRDVVYVPVAVPYYYPAYDYYPEPAPATIPGQLPNVRYDNQYSASFNSSPNAPAPTPPASTLVVVPQPEVYSEPRMIVNEPRPNRVIVPPAIGTSRADVIAQFGQPWGTIATSSQQTLYFDGLTVVLVDGRVTQTR